MQIFKEQNSFNDVVLSSADDQLKEFVSNRLRGLIEYKDYDLCNIVHMLVIEPSDELTDVDAELGFSLLDRPWDVVESHPSWYEITVVVSDDGFGWVIYVPKHANTNAALLEKCATYCKESMP